MIAQIQDKVLAAEVSMMLAVKNAKSTVKQKTKEFFKNEQGDTTIIAIVIVLVIVIALAVVFRENIMEMVNSMWKKIFDTGGGEGSNGPTKVENDSLF